MATAKWARRSPVCESFFQFPSVFTQVFQTVSPGCEAGRTLVSLKQGRHNVMVYAINQTLTADSGWNNSVLIDAFLHGLSTEIKDLEIPDDLDRVNALTNKIDRRIQDRERKIRVGSVGTQSPQRHPQN